MNKITHKITGANVALAATLSGTTVAHPQTFLFPGLSTPTDSDALPNQKTPEQQQLETATGTYATRGYTPDEEADGQAEPVVAVAVDGEITFEGNSLREYDPESRTQTTPIRIPRAYMET